MNHTLVALSRGDALEELRQRNQWVVWRYGETRANGRPEKIPLSPRTGLRASVDDPATWSSYEIAIAAAQEHGYAGVGFVFTADDSFCGIDIDDCVDPDTGEVAEWAGALVEALDSYAEISPSGTGIKVFVRATKPGDRCRTGDIEVYDSGRFFTVTGWTYSGDAIRERQSRLDALYSSLFPPEKENPPAARRASFTDAAVLDKARNAGDWRKFRKLFDRGDTSDFRSHSEADMYLAGRLAFWTGRNRAQMDRLFRHSKLAARPKWTKREDYRDSTLDTAIRNCTAVYDPDYMPDLSPKVRAVLAACEAWALADSSWKGAGGPSDRDVYRALLALAARYGKSHPESGGVMVCAAARSLAPEAGVSVKTAGSALKRLEYERRRISRLDTGGPRRAAMFLILPVLSGSLSCASLESTRRLRHPSKWLLFPISKRAGQILEFVYGRGGATLEDIGAHLGVEPRGYLRRVHVPKLIAAGLLRERDGGGYATPEDLESRLEAHLELSGCNALESRDRARIERERESWRHT